MQTALILLTILGCDDTATQCHYIDTVGQQWSSIEECDRDSERQLDRFASQDYPVIVAVCETAGANAAPAPEKPVEAVAAQTSNERKVPPLPVGGATGANDGKAGRSAPLPEEPTLTDRVKATIAKVLPDVAGVKAIAGKPVHFVTDTYAWVARRLDF